MFKLYKRLANDTRRDQECCGTPYGMVPPDRDELSRRVKAGRLLRDMDQAELGRLFAADGLGRTDPGRIERGTLEMQRVHREAFCRHLRLPDRWFTLESTDEIVGWAQAIPDAPIEDVLAAIREQLSRLEDRLAQTGRDIGLRSLQSRNGTDRPPAPTEAEPLGTASPPPRSGEGLPLP
jgi:hypothetical protein